MEYTIYHINFLTEGLESRLLKYSEYNKKENNNNNNNNYLVTKDDLYSKDKIILLIKNDNDFIGYSYSKFINNIIYLKVIFIKDKYKNLNIESNVIKYLKNNISNNIIDERIKK